MAYYPYLGPDLLLMKVAAEPIVIRELDGSVRCCVMGWGDDSLGVVVESY
jgi:hypothetical protein